MFRRKKRGLNVKIQLPAGVKAPGPIWVILIVVAVAMANWYLPDPRIANLSVILAGLLLPLVVDNNADVNKYQAIISALIAKSKVTAATGSGMRSSAPGSEVAEPTVADLPSKPHPVVGYLFGGTHD